MTEPRRWLTDAAISAELRSVLESAADPPPLPPELHAELTTYAIALASRGALAQVAGAGPLHRSALAGSSSKVLALVSLIGVGGIASFGALSALIPADTRPASPRAAPAPQTAPVTSRRLVSPSPGPSMPAPALEPPAGAARRSAPALGWGVADDPEHRPVPDAGGSAVSIADEAKLLERARSALPDAAEVALALTEQHQRLGPRTQLRAEREFIAIEALLRLGRRAEAERRATPFLQQADDNVYARRLRQLLLSDPARPVTQGTNP